MRRAYTVTLGFGIKGQVKCTVQISIYSQFEWYCLSAVTQFLRKNIVDKVNYSQSGSRVVKTF